MDKIDFFFTQTAQVGEGTTGSQTIQRKVVASHQQFRHRHKGPRHETEIRVIDRDIEKREVNQLTKGKFSTKEGNSGPPTRFGFGEENGRHR